jgi:hypothetical protein
MSLLPNSNIVNNTRTCQLIDGQAFDADSKIQTGLMVYLLLLKLSSPVNNYNCLDINSCADDTS